MGFLFAFFGAVGGLSLSSQERGENIALASIFAFALLCLALAKKQWIPYLLGLGLLLTFGLLWRLLPIALGRGEALGVVTKTGENYFLLRTFFHSYYVAAKGHDYQVGDILRISGNIKELKMTTYESQFSFLDYLKNLGAKGEIASPRIQDVFCVPLRIGAMRNRFLSSFDSSTSGLLGALLFGRKDYDSSIIASADGLGLLFALSSSGLLFGWLLTLICNGVHAISTERKGMIASLIAGALLLPLNIEKIGLSRVYLGRLVKFIDKKEKLDYFSRLGLSGLILIAINPFHALSSGLWIGVGISLSRYLFSSFLEEKKKAIAFIKNYVFVQLFLLPLTLSSGDIHLFSFLYAPVLLPFMAIFAAMGILSFITLPFVHPLQGYASFLERMMGFFGKVNIALPLPAISATSVFLLYCCLFLGLFLHEMGFRRTRNALVIAISSILCISLLPAGYLGLEGLYFVNVGQGDCTLIYDRGTAVMIDTGGVVGMDIATETLIPYLRKKRIYHLDALIITHPDYDHYGGKDSLTAHFDVRRCIEEAEEFPLSIGRLHFENYNLYGGDEANDRSLVLDFKAVGKRVLVMGDAPVEVEAKIMNDHPEVDCDILKVGHHGSDTSTSEKWLDAVTPEIAVISCGRKNSYGHPSPKVMERLEARSITVRRTDLEGSVEYCRFSP